ncbi:lipopolysaccharide biosynthesis protein [Dysgonomonas massiliensis]|uniref:lipopolysaccharide biosynthesis protein n=1 Tax=Dysgonomonas massiliensis TaxID=2040292 RepID=UPI0011AEE9AA|nr:lipopolysaccharide biosynthesis protein [Dysgonomonas massiliensis]
MSDIDSKEKSTNNKRIAKNTLFLYFRLIVTMLVSLYTSRIVLKVLGVEDYGIYNVVGSMVGMMAFLNGTMAAATQRFLSFEIGKGDFKTLTKVYSTTIQIHVVIALIIILLSETLGLWFLYSKMNFPAERADAVFWVYQFSVLSLALSVIQVPYNAAIIAFERMNVYAYMSLLDVSLKLLCVFLLTLIDVDKLVLYAALIFSISLIIRALYVFYVRKYLKACKYEFCWDVKLSKSILSYACYNFIAHFSLMLRNQGVNILLNIFFGPLINAANGVAVQVRNAVNSFTQNFIVAVNPQIVKSYAANNLEYTRLLIMQSSKFSFILLCFLSLPFLLETDYILHLWLENPPKYSVLFCQLMIVNILVDALSGTLVYGALATGKVKKYQLVIGMLFLMCLPISYLFLKLGFSPEITIIVSIFISFVALLIRLFFLRILLSLSVKLYLWKVVILGIVILGLSLIVPLFIITNIETSFLRLLLTGFTSSISLVFYSYFIGLNNSERIIVKNKLISFILKLKLKKR